MGLSPRARAAHRPRERARAREGTSKSVHVQFPDPIPGTYGSPLWDTPKFSDGELTGKPLVASPARSVLTDRPPPPSHVSTSDAVDAYAVTAQVQIDSLSRREREVFDLMALGFTHREIAAKLFVSVKTIETHRTRIGEKLWCRNLREIMHRAYVGGALRKP